MSTRQGIAARLAGRRDDADEREDQRDRPHIEHRFIPRGLLAEPVGVFGSQAELPDEPGQCRLEPVRGGRE